MTERFNQSSEHAEEYESAMRVEKALADIQDLSKEYLLSVLTSDEEAQALATEYMSICNSIITACPKTKDTVLCAKGDGVKLLNWRFIINEDGQVAPSIDREQLYIAQPFYEQQLFTLMSIHAGVRHDKESGGWFLNPTMQGKKLYPDTMSVDAPSGLPLMSIAVESTLLIPCAQDNAQVEVHMLSEDRRKTEAVEVLERFLESGDAEVVNKVRAVDEILKAEPNDFVDFQPLDLLHELDLHSVEFSRLNAKKVDTLNDTLVAVLGEGRVMKFTGIWYRQQDDATVVAEEVCEEGGELVTIVTGVSAVPVQGSSFVINHYHPNDSVSVCYVPFSEISAMKV
jgi:hypothetical protein